MTHVETTNLQSGGQRETHRREHQRSSYLLEQGHTLQSIAYLSDVVESLNKKVDRLDLTYLTNTIVPDLNGQHIRRDAEEGDAVPGHCDAGCGEKAADKSHGFRIAEEHFVKRI